MEIAYCFCCGREIADGEICSDCRRELQRLEFSEDRTTEARWLREADETRRESGYRPGQE